MSYLVLARKWRPKRFSELVGQEHVVRALGNALDTGRVHHAFLFTGTRGVGKTTIARIFAKSLNCEQGTSAEPYVLWVERIAQAYKLAPLCPVYKFNGTTFAPNSQAGCTNHAIGGGRRRGDARIDPGTGRVLHGRVRHVVLDGVGELVVLALPDAAERDAQPARE